MASSECSAYVPPHRVQDKVLEGGKWRVTQVCAISAHLPVVLSQQQPAMTARPFGERLFRSSATALRCTHSPFRWNLQPTRTPTAFSVKTPGTSSVTTSTVRFRWAPICCSPVSNTEERKNQRKRFEKFMIQSSAHFILLH